MARQLLPNFERAIIPIEKIRDYVLNSDHSKGKNKARVIKTMLGIERRHANGFADTIKGTLGRAVAQKQKESSYGTHWLTYHEMIGINGQLRAILTVAWIFKTAQPDTPLLLTCYIDTKRQEQFAKMLRESQ